MNKKALQELRAKVHEANAVSAQDLIAFIDALVPSEVQEDESDAATKKPAPHGKGEK